MRSSLRAARIKAGYTQQQVAIRLGCGQQCVAKHELGQTSPSHFKIIREYERLFGVRAERLFPDIFGNT